MTQKIIALCGVLLFVVALACSISLWVASRQATQLNATEHTSGGGPPIPPCDVSSINVPTVMSDQESQTVVVTLSQPDSKPGTSPNPNDPGCLEMIGINAPDFNVSTLDKGLSTSSSTPPTLPANRETATVSWILSPQKQGLYKIQVGGNNITYTYGINVTDVLGLSVGQAKLMTVIGSILGFLATTLATANSWWLDRLRRLLRRRRKRTAFASSSEKSSIAYRGQRYHSKRR